MKRQYLNRFIEFFIVGVCMGLVEDITAIWFATEAQITVKVVLIALLVAIPFAIVSELIVDWQHFKTVRKIKDEIETALGTKPSSNKRRTR